MRLLQEAFKAEFERVLARDQMSRSAAARRLGISRQALYNYLGGAIPRKELLARIVELWPDFHVEAGGQVFDKASLTPIDSGKLAFVPQQLNLFDKLRGLTQDDLKISVRQLGEETQVSVTIRISA